MQVIEVNTPLLEKEFLHLPLKIYKNDEKWIRPLDKDIEFVFDKANNKFFKHGECIRWILKNRNHETIGRVAAFIDNKTAIKNNDQPTGGMGFFECINDVAAAHYLFDTCKVWLQQRRMEAMDGPINFGERDSWWGLLVDGFAPPGYKMNYNPSYYQSLFESYGFRIYFQQFCYGLDVKNKIQNKFFERHALIQQDGNYSATYLRKNKLMKFAEDFKTVYNKAWVKHGSGKELETRQVQLFFKKMKPIIDEKIIWFVYYKDEPVAFWINLPDINQLFKHFNGKFGIWQKIQFLWMLKRKRADRFIGIVFGVTPEHQGKGVDSFLIVEAAKIVQTENRYESYEMNWIGDFNPKMIAVAESLGTWKSRTFNTYRKLFDETKLFKRHPVL
jgi:hypothetical protein